jgi:hypothetical protein
LVSENGSEIFTRHLHKASRWDALGQIATAAHVCPRGLVDSRPTEDERRHADKRKHVADVDVEIHSQVRGSRAGADAETEDAREGREFVRRRARVDAADHLVLERLLAPAACVLFYSALHVGLRRKPRQIGSAHEARRRVQQGESGGALRVCGGEEHAEWATFT